MRHNNECSTPLIISSKIELNILNVFTQFIAQFWTALYFISIFLIQVRVRYFQRILIYCNLLIILRELSFPCDVSAFRKCVILYFLSRWILINMSELHFHYLQLSILSCDTCDHNFNIWMGTQGFWVQDHYGLYSKTLYHKAKGIKC